ncbi:MAG: IclR family transcriptional regulator [Lautropia sp.]
MPESPVKSGVAAQRAIEILELVARAARPIAGNEIMQDVKLAKPTVYRICALLEGMGLIQRHPDNKKLTVGPRLCSLALDALFNSPTRGPIRSVLQALSDETRETCTFTILDGNEVVCVDRVESEEPLRLQLRSGSRIPLHCTASGKLFLSMLPANRAKRLLNSVPLRRMTSNTIVDPAQLRSELRRIRKERISRDDQGFCNDLIAIAVPVMGASGQICGAVSVNAPATRMSLAEAEAHVPALRRAADAIGTSLSDY